VCGQFQFNVALKSNKKATEENGLTFRLKALLPIISLPQMHCTRAAAWPGLPDGLFSNQISHFG
jgi:hypothetical protein